MLARLAEGPMPRAGQQQALGQVAALAGKEAGEGGAAASAVMVTVQALTGRMARAAQEPVAAGKAHLAAVRSPGRRRLRQALLRKRP